MKGIFSIVVVLALLAAAAWFFYDPHLRPHVEKLIGASSMNDEARVIDGASAATSPAVPARTAVAPAPKSASAPPPAAVATPAAPAPKSELEQALESKYPMPRIAPLASIVDQWRNVPAKAFPAEVVASEALSFQLVVNGQVIGSSNVSPGTPLKPLRLEGDRLVVGSPTDPSLSAPIAVDKTDFKARIEARYEQFVESKTAEVAAKRQRAREIVTKDPSRLAQLTGQGTPAATVTGPGGDPRVSPVIESLRKGEIASVTVEEARSFQWNGTEKIGGEHAGSYDTVTVHFEVSTIFGVFPIDYKALLSGGRVVAWIDPVTEDPAS